MTGIFLLWYIKFIKESHDNTRHPRRYLLHAMNTTMLSALAESNRLQIVELLCSGPLTVGEVADRLHIRQPQASKHLKVLLEAGLVEVEADANRRIYKLRLEPFKELNAWLEGYRDIWENRFDNLNHYLQQLFQKEQKQEE